MEQQEMSDARKMDGWGGLATSLMRLVSASTVFSIQQTQNSFDLLTDSRKALNELQRSVDALSDAMMGKVDPSKQSIADQVTETSARILHTASVSSSPSSGGGQNGGEWQQEEALTGRKR